MLVKMEKNGREIDVNSSSASIAALEEFGWKIAKKKTKSKKKKSHE